jgi:hypothetical protein
VAAGSGSRVLARYAWAGGVLYVVALVTEAVISVGFKVSQDDSAAILASWVARSVAPLTKAAPRSD